MNKKISVLIGLQLMFAMSFAQNNITISSPDKKIELSCNVATMLYSISFNKEVVLKDSKLGIIREDENFTWGLKLIKSSPSILIKDNYTILTAKKKNITYSANKKVMETITASGKKMNIVFQVSNDGVAFKYEFPEQDNTLKKITAEVTSFHFLNGTKAWLQEKTEAQSGWEHSNPSYEAHYKMDIATGTPSPSKNGWVYPALFKSNDVWVLLSEAALGRTYCCTALKQQSPDNEYSIGFPQAEETIKDQPLNPESTLPWQTPWRIVAIGTLKTIMESTLGTDLAFPAKKMDLNFIKPGKSSWSWIMKKDDSTIYRVQKNYVDYASSMQWQYCLLDANWDTLIGYDSVAILSAYAKQKNIGLLLWYNSAGAWNTVKYHPKDKLLTHESRVKEFARLQAMGIKGIKIDFFGGDGQSFINYYQDILEDAATYHLLVNFHGATLPRGWQRTYPNLMTTEAIYGFEMITFNQKDADIEPSHGIMAAMVRNVFDPMDFTPVCLYKIPKKKRVTTQGYELATAVAYLSGIQHYAESPEGMTYVEPSVKACLKEIPSVWDEVKFIDGFPGKLFVVARRAGNKWFVAGLNGEAIAKNLELDLSFISKQITGTIFNDNLNSINNLTAARMDIVAASKNNITLQPNGGFLLVF
ncbi:MAG: glycoside hydrolase family 97 catalytic domain-containing protein [Chitinophagaceae bacterium]|nr:glycoside hydrolase family 97 catalytic domain-containing protein [Chitinophagaceae bacterium]